MSSSNPFRRSKLPDSVALPPTTPSGGGDAGDAAFATPRQQTKKKRVKIQTPPPLSPELTPEYGGRRLSASDSATRAESPPPPPQPFDLRDDETDSTATADDELEEALRNTRRNSGSLPHPNATPTAQMKAPYNPFARTLASGGGNAASTQEDDRTQRTGGGRPALDVDAFKNILMTGSAVPSPPTGRANTAGHSSRQHDTSSSNTDTSSIFDPSYSLHPESPRTSFDEYEDTSEGEDHEDERSTLMVSGGMKMDDLAPPAPPKPKSKGPQTVSFAEFNQSIPPEFQAVGPPPPPANHHLTSILRPSLSRSSSDLNKPLPPPPKSPAEPPPPTVPDKDLHPPRPDLPNVDVPKKAPAPPPPPPTRRKVGEATHPRSGSNLSNSTADVPSSAVEQSLPGKSAEESTSKLAPPPPPARKSQPTPLSKPSPTTSKDSSPNHSTNSVPKTVPPPPPRRNPSKLGRGDGQESATPPSQKPGDAFLSSLVPNQNAPPAPPPRRAGGSKRSSLDSAPDTLARRLSSDHSRRTSGNSFDSERSTSISSLQQVGEVPEQVIVSPPAESQRDILADMSAFQAEIDALRASSEKRK